MSLHRITHPADALAEILRMCHESTTYSRRTQMIHEAAMRGLGMTASQRHARHMAIMTRVGPEPGRTAYEARMAKRIATQIRSHQRQLAAEAAEAGRPVPAPRPFHDWMTPPTTGESTK